jgi:hypothetical protein
MADAQNQRGDDKQTQGVDGEPPPDLDNDCCPRTINTFGCGWTGWWGVVIALVIAVLVAVVFTYTLIAFWPETSARPVGWKIVQFLGLTFNVGRDTAMFAVVILAGALGGMVHTLRSLTWYFGNGKLRHRWLLFYCAIPGSAGLLALLFYLLLRGGLLSAQASSGDLNVFGFTAISGVVGFASEQAARKLVDVFSTLFTSAEHGKDHQPPKNKPNGKSTDPATNGSA